MKYDMALKLLVFAFLPLLCACWGNSDNENAIKACKEKRVCEKISFPDFETRLCYFREDDSKNVVETMCAGKTGRGHEEHFKKNCSSGIVRCGSADDYRNFCVCYKK
ncbi:uncharacterized protein [Dermacentor albipictus]|uniref:uncharacterized protein n=1 Tax=Dermacentor albipictus TaxID=60249 RepID=UPI0038FC07E1